MCIRRAILIGLNGRHIWVHYLVILNLWSWQRVGVVSNFLSNQFGMSGFQRPRLRRTSWTVFMVVFLLFCFFRLSPAISVTWENAATLPCCHAPERFHGEKKTFTTFQNDRISIFRWTVPLNVLMVVLLGSFAEEVLVSDGSALCVVATAPLTDRPDLLLCIPDKP